MSILNSVRGLVPLPLKNWLTKSLHNYQPLPPIAPTTTESAAISPYQSWVSTSNLLTELGEKYAPTKRYHNYLLYYWIHFRDVREQVRTVLEIGVESDRSVRMWREFFPNATIYGIDINPKCAEYESERIKIFIGSQSDTAFLSDCLKKMDHAPDIIIDDGSHRIDHQIITFNFLFPKMSDHGVYAVEDTGGCVNDPRLRTVNRLKTLIDSVFYWPSDPKTHWSTLSEFPASATWADRNVTGVAFYRWLVFVMRGRNPQDNPYLPLKNEVASQDHLLPLIHD